MFNFNNEMAGTYISIIYIISAILSPVVGYLIDKIG